MTIEYFIKDFRGKSKVIVDKFLNGYCYYFAVILKDRFPLGEIYYSTLNHFVFKYCDRLYDITGDCTKEWDDEYLYKWEDYQRIEEGSTHLTNLIVDSILKL